MIIIINIINVNLDCHIIYSFATKTKYRNGLNAAPDTMIGLIHLSGIKPDI